MSNFNLKNDKDIDFESAMQEEFEKQLEQDYIESLLDSEME